MARVVENPQMQFGEVDISQIQWDKKSRDEMPQVLRGLQYLYINPSIRNEIFQLLEKRILPGIDKKNGRPGMALWKILILGVVRLNLNWDYDRLQDEANNHKKLRQMLGHSDWSDETYYEIQTLKDNISLLTPELLDEINQVIVRSGHALLKKKENEVLRGRCDSFVVETDVHFPTDINLLFDAMRKVIQLTARLCARHGLNDWRQSEYNVRHLKKLMRIAQSKKRASAKTEEQKKKRQERIIEAHQNYLDITKRYLQKACDTLSELEKQESLDRGDILLRVTIDGFVKHAERQISQVDRRVMNGEKIPHSEKIFSIFEPHTEWVSKGKAGVPVELGLKVCVLEDQHQFILYHQVMQKQTDDEIAIPMVDEAKKRFPNLSSMSFDKGFHSPENQKELSTRLDCVALPRKGKLSEAARQIESDKEFRQARRQHSAVESAINALEVHGLDRCLDQGLWGFKRYVSLAVMARNIQQIGALLKRQEMKREERLKRRHASSNDAVVKKKLAA